MPGSHPVRWIILLCGALAAFGCANTETDQGAAGSLSLDLVLAGDIEIDVVDWQITGNGMDMGGSVDVSAPGSTASVEVYGLPVGKEPYTVELSAVSVDQQVTCRGSAEFDIEVGVSTPVMVMLNCKLPQELGGVRVNGKFNICAQLTKVVVSPLQTSVGNDISLFSTAQDEEGDPIAFLWSSHSGSIADPVAASTTYTCTEVGDDDITVLVTDDDGTYCMSMWTVRVTCVAGDGNPCDDVTCEDDGNECTSEACNPGTGQCETSNVADGTDCDGSAGMCTAGTCVAKNLCMDVVCEDDDNDCTAEICNPDTGECETSNVDNGTICNNASGMCMNGDCVPNDLCIDVVCEDTGNDCTAAACNPSTGQCETSNVDNGTACDGETGTCNEGVCEPNPECVVDADCPDTGNECIDAVCDAGTCGTSNNTDACDGGAGTCNAGTCEPNAEVFYEENFEGLDATSGTALGTQAGGAGFVVFGNVFDPVTGANIGFYGTFTAPNGTGAFCNVAVGEGGAEQGAQQLVVFSDYNNNGEQNAGNLVEGLTFQETTITADDVGKTLTFTFQAKLGDLSGGSTAYAFVKTIDPGSGFAQTNFRDLDMTTILNTWNTYTITLALTDPLLEGQLLQFGFSATATNFEPSGVFYDNLLVTLE